MNVGAAGRSCVNGEGNVMRKKGRPGEAGSGHGHGGAESEEWSSWDEGNEEEEQ